MSRNDHGRILDRRQGFDRRPALALCPQRELQIPLDRFGVVADVVRCSSAGHSGRLRDSVSRLDGQFGPAAPVLKRAIVEACVQTQVAGDEVEHRGLQADVAIGNGQRRVAAAGRTKNFAQ